MGCLHCFECCKSFKESKTEFRKEESTGCCCCEGLSSSTSSNDVARRKRGCCCFPWKKSSKKEDEESRREGKGKKCFTCFKSSKEGGKGASFGSGCLCNGDSSRSRESRGCVCFSCKKLSKKEGKEHNCFSCFRPSKEEVNERNRRGDVNGCCFHCKNSCDEDKEPRREPDNGCFSCFSLSKKEGKERKSSCNGGCFCCGESTSKVEPSETRGHCCLSSKRSSKEDPKSRGKAKICLSCFRTSSKSDPSKREEAKKKEGRKNRCCLPCCCVCKSSKDNSLKKEGGETRFCFQCCNHKSSKEPVREETRIQQKKSLEDSTKKRGSKVMCCCAFCCTKALDERKTTSKTKCSLSCFCCVQESYQNSSMKKRKKGLTCLHIKEQSQDGNGRTSTMHNTSFTSDNDGKSRSQAEQILPLANGNIKVQVFTYKEIVAATENFNEDFLLGSGGFGKVYKGEHLGKHEVVAVKQLKGNDNHINNEFLVDVVTLSLLHHPNLIKLLGYCAERDQMILVYEYMPFGSLQNHLLDIAPNTKPLDWHTRMKIAAGAAKGLEHLHDVANPPMVYRDMKASNILLDENYNPKLSDFGLEKPTRVMGTYGCCAPEYAFTRKLTKTTDVYSFGVLLLELITGRKAIDNTRLKTEQYLAHWAAPRFKDKRKFPKMADPILNGNFPIKDLYQALAIANMCLQYEASSRPLMSDVATAIEYLVKTETDCSEYFEELQIHHQLHLPNHEKLEISGDSRLRTSTVSFDGETFQSISSDIDLREEEEEEDCQ